MQQPANPNFSGVLARIPTGLFVLTSCHDDTRSGVLVQWVQQCSADPPMVVVALRKGHPIEPLIRDSRLFGLSSLRITDTYLKRKFEAIPDHGDDPFISLPTFAAPGGSPVLDRATAWLECELLRHLDIECDYELYIGLVRAGGIASAEDERVAAGRSTSSAVSNGPGNGSGTGPVNGPTNGKGRPPETDDDPGARLKSRRRRSA